jgi:protein-disulfide isomerase
VEAQIQKLISVVSTLIALQVVTLAAVFGVTWYSHDDLKQSLGTIAGAARGSRTPDPVENWARLIREHDATLGRNDAPVVLVEYSDFQCPYCKTFTDGTRRQIAAKYGDKVRMVFKHYPLEQAHPQAMTAAIAAQCARREGKFWEVHDRFFSQPNALDVASVIAVGKSLGLSDRYAECVTNQETKAEIEQDVQDAMEVGVQGTPTLMVNGKFLVGAVSEAAFKPLFKAAGLTVD